MDSLDRRVALVFRLGFAIAETDANNGAKDRRVIGNVADTFAAGFAGIGRNEGVDGDAVSLRRIHTTGCQILETRVGGPVGLEYGIR